jgi:hypothetical protein
MHATQPMSAPATELASSSAMALWQRWQDLGEHLVAPLSQALAPAPFVASIAYCTQHIMQLTHADPDLAIFRMIHCAQEPDPHYSVTHALHTALLMALIGRRKDWGDGQTSTGIKAALTMNIAITQLQNELACQAGALSDAQRQTIHNHPLASAQCLLALGVQDEDWLQAVRQHHEQADGKGYPLGLTEANPLADALHTCDVFGAKMSPRVGRPSMPSPKAASDIFRQRSAGYFGATIIREMGLYPPGSRVLLRTGEQAVVLRRTAHAQRPAVAVVSDAHGAGLTQAWHCHAIGPRAIASPLPSEASGEQFRAERVLQADSGR